VSQQKKVLDGRLSRVEGAERVDLELYQLIAERIQHVRRQNFVSESVNTAHQHAHQHAHRVSHPDSDRLPIGQETEEFGLLAKSFVSFRELGEQVFALRSRRLEVAAGFPQPVAFVLNRQ
jgi:hypothetical protein